MEYGRADNLELDGESTTEIEDRMQLAFLAWVATYLRSRRISRRRQHDAPFTGAMYTQWLLTSHPNNLVWATRLNRHNYRILRGALLETGYYEEQQSGIQIDEALVMFLSCIAYDKRMRELADRFQHSLDTIKRSIDRMRRALYLLSFHIIVPRNWRATHPKIMANPYLFPYFQDCIGAIDGTHVPAWAPDEIQQEYRNRHSDLSQNVLAVVDHDMRFVYVRAGYPGSAHDAMVLQNAITDSRGNFPMPLNGKFYAVDSAYRNMPGFMAPFRGYPANVEQYRNRAGIFNSAKELFNYRHAQVRNVVERAFGSLKKRCEFLKGPMYSYSQEAQAEFVIACCTVHNIIVENDPDLPIFNEVSQGDMTQFAEVGVQQADFSDTGAEIMRDFRNHISNTIWNSHR